MISTRLSFVDDKGRLSKISVSLSWHEECWAARGRVILAWWASFPKQLWNPDSLEMIHAQPSTLTFSSLITSAPFLFKLMMVANYFLAEDFMEGEIEK